MRIGTAYIIKKNGANGRARMRRGKKEKKKVIRRNDRTATPEGTHGRRQRRQTQPDREKYTRRNEYACIYIYIFFRSISKTFLKLIRFI